VIINPIHRTRPGRPACYAQAVGQAITKVEKTPLIPHPLRLKLPGGAQSLWLVTMDARSPLVAGPEGSVIGLEQACPTPSSLKGRIGKFCRITEALIQLPFTKNGSSMRCLYQMSIFLDLIYLVNFEQAGFHQFGSVRAVARKPGSVATAATHPVAARALRLCLVSV
jgi:hypothetical protein